MGTHEAYAALHEVVDEVVCLALPEPFHGVAAHYRSFPQVEDAEVIRVLGSHRASPA